MAIDGAGELSELCDQKTLFAVDGQCHRQEPSNPLLERRLKKVADMCGLMHYPASVFLFCSRLCNHTKILDAELLIMTVNYPYRSFSPKTLPPRLVRSPTISSAQQLALLLSAPQP